MKYYHLIAIVLILIVVFFLGKGCSKDEVYVKGVNVDSILQDNKNLQRDIQILQTFTESEDSVITVYKTKYKYIKDTLIIKLPCDTVLKLVIAACDSIILHDSLAINGRDSIIGKQGKMITNYQTIRASDSTAIAAHSKEVKKLKRKIILWKVISAAEAALLGISLVR